MINIRRLRFLTSAAILLLSVLFAACAAPPANESSAAMPDYVLHADHNVLESYQYAVDHPDHFETIPCYCGCYRIGHKSELNCFIADREDDGTVVFDNHASVCGVCIDIAQDVIRLRAEGKSGVEVRDAIDATYSKIGQGTNTRYPTE